MKSNEIIGGIVGTSISATGTALQTNEMLQTISLVITIIGALITYIVMPLLLWYKKSKKDGKITKEEIKEGIDIIYTGAEEIKKKKEEEK